MERSWRLMLVRGSCAAFRAWSRSLVTYDRLVFLVRGGEGCLLLGVVDDGYTTASSSVPRRPVLLRRCKRHPSLLLILRLRDGFE